MLNFDFFRHSGHQYERNVPKVFLCWQSHNKNTLERFWYPLYLSHVVIVFRVLHSVASTVKQWIIWQINIFMSMVTQIFDNPWLLSYLASFTISLVAILLCFIGHLFARHLQVGGKEDDQTFPITQISPLVFTASMLIVVAIFMAVINRILWGPRINDLTLEELQVGKKQVFIAIQD